MFELTIKENVYQFKFGMGFMREINKRIKAPVDGLKDVTQNIGLRYFISSIISGDMEALVEVLNVANFGFTPRLTNGLLDAYLEDEETDIDKLFEDVLGFLKTANVTKKVTLEILAEVEKAKAAQNQ